MHLIVFQIDSQLLAFDLTEVNRVIMAIEITPLPEIVEPLMGVINVHGEMIPVINLRKILGMPNKDIEIADKFLICTTKTKQRVALWVDTIKKVASYSEELLIPAQQLFPQMKAMASILQEEGQVIFVYKLDKLLPVELISTIAKAS